MTQIRVANLGLLLRCYEGLRNWRALAMLVIGFVVAVLLMALDGAIATRMAFEHPFMAMTLSAVLGIIAALVVLSGVNGAGLLLTDQADGQPLRGFSAAFFGGLGVTLQAIVCLIALGIGMLLVVLVLWALSFLAHIPGIGPLFAFLLAGPTMIILAFCYAVLAFGIALMFVALWRGNGVTGSIGRAIDIVLKRPLDVVLHFIVLALLVVPIEFFVVAVMFGGAALTGAMYASGSLLGGGGFGGGSLLGGGGGGLMSSLMGGAGAALGATAVSIGIVIAAVSALFVLIQMLGTVLIYDSLAAGTAAGSADFLRKKAAEVKAKVEEHRPRAPITPTPAAATPASAALAVCTSCGAALTAGDRFCGECGTPRTA